MSTIVVDIFLILITNYVILYVYIYYVSLKNFGGKKMGSTVKMYSTDYDTKTLFGVAATFVGSSSITFENVGACYDMSNKMVSNLLYRGIAENIYPSILAEAIYAKIMKVNKRGYRYSYSRWDKAFEERLEKRKELSERLKLLTAKKMQFDFVIENYNTYAEKVDSPLALEVLIEKRTQIETRIKNISLSLR